VAPEKLKDIQVWGTMLEGRVQPVGGKQPKATPAVKGKAPLKAASNDGAQVDRAVVASLASLMQHKHSH
jgi:hypothetical protein